MSFYTKMSDVNAFLSLKLMKTAAIFLLAFLLTNSASAQCSPELEKYTSGFDGLKSSSFSFLDNELEDVRIVGYGEDTHGTAEFTLLAEELMKYLTTNHGFKVLIIETGFGEGAFLNDYIQGKRNDLKVILESHNSTWRYQTKEFHGLMNRLREYNQKNTDKIYIYGSEMQYVVSDVNRVRDYLKSVKSDYRIDGFEKHLWEDITEAEKSDFYISYVKLKRYFNENAESFKKQTSEKEFQMASHHVEVLGQFVTAINQNVVQRKHDFRDIYIAENIQWILNYHGSKSKALYWAHNAHVGDWVSNGIVDVAGHQLRKVYRESYFNIATDFGTGEFVAFPHNADEIGWKMQIFNVDAVLANTFTSCLKQFGKPNTFLNLRNARVSDSLRTMLDGPLTVMSGAGAQAGSRKTETVDIGKAFDGIIYVDKTTTVNFVE